MKAKMGRNVLGRGRLSRRGMVIRITRTTRGYMESGRTNVFPPIPAGKKGKLVTGSVMNKRPQAIFTILG